MASKVENRSRNLINRGVGEQRKDSTGNNIGLTGGLSTALPKPNILRIEVLDGNARERYLSAVQLKGDELRQKIYQNVTLPGERLFYGFLVGGGETGFSLSTQWERQTGSGAILDNLKGIAGLVPGGNTVVGGAQQALDNIGEIGGSLLGINKSTTGSGTVKDFTSIALTDYTLTCGWYLPEQYHLCVKSLKALYRMAYPKQTDVESILSKMSDVVSGITSNNELKRAASNANKEGESAPGLTDRVIDSGIDLVKDTANLVMNVQEAFGVNYTFNPLPVRASVGQYMDIEPLVITNVNTSFSKETFINYSGKEKGRHLPITVKVSITFEYWLNPAPDLEFTSLLGEEMFGQSPLPSNALKTLESSESYARRLGANNNRRNFEGDRSNSFGGNTPSDLQGL